MSDNQPRFNPAPYLAPKYWLTWLGIFILWVITLLPYKLIMRLGVIFGLLIYYLIPSRRHIVSTNIKLCFPELSQEEKQKLIKKSFISLGKGLLETAMAWWWPQQRFQKLIKINGLEHVTDTLAEGKSVMLLVPHFCSMELGGRLLPFRDQMLVVYKKLKNPLMEAILAHARKKEYYDIVDTYNTRQVVKGLKQNLVTWYAMDQDFGTKQSVFVPFMGVTCSTLVTPARLAKLSGAVVIPYFYKRLENDKGYELTFSEPLESFPTGNDIEDAGKVNEIFGNFVKHAPEQYFWAHRRFKTRPVGEASYY